MTDSHPTGMRDVEILQRLSEDLGEGVRILLEVHGGRVRNYLRKRYTTALDDHQIEDALADAALKLVETYDASKGKPLGGWLLFLADRHAIDGLRKEQRHQRQRAEMPESDFDAGRRSPASELVDDEFAERVQQIIATQLSDLERKVMTADIDEGGAVNAKQLAERFGTDPRSIYTARLRARKKLAKGLDGEVSC